MVFTCVFLCNQETLRLEHEEGRYGDKDVSNVIRSIYSYQLSEENEVIDIETYLRSPKSPSPGIMYALSLSPSSIQPVITFSMGNREQNAFRPSGAAI